MKKEIPFKVPSDARRITFLWQAKGLGFIQFHEVTTYSKSREAIEHFAEAYYGKFIEEELDGYIQINGITVYDSAFREEESL